MALTLISFFTVLFAEQIPRPPFDAIGFLTDRYPPVSLAA